MKRLFWMWAVFTVALWLTSLLVPGMVLKGFLPAVLASLVLGLLNTLVQPLLLAFRLVTLPLNLLTLGLFALVTSFVLNALLLWLVGQGWIPSFRVHGAGAALLGALILGIINGVLSALTGVRRRR